MGRLSVPVLTLISGYLLFSSKLDRIPFKLYKKKFFTLVIPFFFFNVVYFSLQYALEYFFHVAPLFNLVELDRHMIIRRLTSYDGMPLNDPLHFLRDLVVLVMIAPLFGFFIRNAPFIGLNIVFVMFMSDLDGHFVNRNTMAVLFYIGGWAAVRRWDVRSLDRFALWGVALLFFACATMMFYRISSYTYLYLIAPFAVWPASSMLVNTYIGKLAVMASKYSFYLFLIHTPIIRVLQLVYPRLSNWVSPNVYLVLSFVSILVFTYVSYNLANIVFPRAFSFVIGGRVKRSTEDTKITTVPIAVEKFST